MASKQHRTSIRCVIFTLCLRFGVVPTSFTSGLLIPLLKKPTCDPSVPKNYRPIIVYKAFSKILEMYTLDECGCHDFEDAQFGFVPGRGTNMAISVTRDVISYCVNICMLSGCWRSFRRHSSFHIIWQINRYSTRCLLAYVIILVQPVNCSS